MMPLTQWGAKTASFVYDALGRRESKTIGGTATSFGYGGPTIVSAQRVQVTGHSAQCGGQRFMVF